MIGRLLSAVFFSVALAVGVGVADWLQLETEYRNLRVDEPGGRSTRIICALGVNKGDDTTCECKEVEE